MKKENNLIKVDIKKESEIINATKKRYPCFNFWDGYPCRYLIYAQIFTRENSRPIIKCKKTGLAYCPDVCKFFNPK